MKTNHDCKIEKINFRGWNAYSLENGLIRLIAVPDIGGRIMAYDLGPYAYFFVDPDLAGKLFSPEENYGKGELADWKNYGGDKTWPAPQGWDNDEQWHGPPDPVLDTGNYRVVKAQATNENAVIVMESPPDPVTGVQIQRQFQIKRGSSRVKVNLTFKNTKDVPVRWSIWDVAQLRAERMLEDGSLIYESKCSVTTKVNPQSKFDKGYFVIAGDEENPQWTVDQESSLFSANYLWKIGKIGIDSEAGWIAFTNSHEGYAFTEQFDYEDGMEYPDNGSTVECWTVGEGIVGTLDYSDSKIFLMETEVLAPLREISPDETINFTIEWGACRVKGKVLDVAEAGCISEPLSIKLDDGYAVVKGEFGVYDEGSLSLSWLSSDGSILEKLAICDVTPLSVVCIDKMIKMPEDAAKLQIETEVGKEKHLLVSADLP